MIDNVITSQLAAPARIWIAVSILLMVGGCDGGIFGTGDGEDPTIVQPGETVEDVNMGVTTEGTTTGGTTTEGTTTEGTTTGGTTTAGTTMPPDSFGVSFVSADSVGSFANSEITTNRNDAQLKLINASPDDNLSIVAINNNMVETPLFPLPGITTIVRDSGYLTINNPANAIALFTAADVSLNDFSDPIASIDPFTLASGTATTLILRGIPNDPETPLELLALGNQTQAGANNAQIRAIHAATTLGMNIDIVLKPTVPEQVVETIIGQNLSFQNGISEYVSPLAGSYELIIRDTNNTDLLVTEPESITLTPNQVVTLILLDKIEPTTAGVSVLKSQDSDL